MNGMSIPAVLNERVVHGRVLTNILSDEHSRAEDSGAHRIALEPYGYRWYRVG